MKYMKFALPAKRQPREKKKAKEKEDINAVFLEAQARKAAALEKLAEMRAKEEGNSRIKEENSMMKQYMNYLIVDTSHMT